MAENKGVIKRQEDGDISKGHRSQFKKSPKDKSWGNLSNKINKVAWDYNALYKTKIHELIVIIND